MPPDCLRRYWRFRLGRFQVKLLIIKCLDFMPITLTKITEFDDTGVTGYRVNSSFTYEESPGVVRAIEFEAFDEVSEQDAIDAAAEQMNRVLVPAQLLHNVLTDSPS